MVDHSKCDIIVIDDEEDVRESLKQLFSLEGFKVYAMANAKEALEFISTKFQGVIISDIRMPEMDGLTFLKEVKKLNKSFFNLSKFFIISPLVNFFISFRKVRPSISGILISEIITP